MQLSRWRGVIVEPDLLLMEKPCGDPGGPMPAPAAHPPRVCPPIMGSVFKTKPELTSPASFPALNN